MSKSVIPESFYEPRIEGWLQQFADLLEMPELWQDIAKMRPKTK